LIGQELQKAAAQTCLHSIVLKLSMTVEIRTPI
jgi:hypothetical protein